MVAILSYGKKAWTSWKITGKPSNSMAILCAHSLLTYRSLQGIPWHLLQADTPQPSWWDKPCRLISVDAETKIESILFGRMEHTDQWLFRLKPPTKPTKLQVSLAVLPDRDGTVFCLSEIRVVVWVSGFVPGLTVLPQYNSWLNGQFKGNIWCLDYGLVHAYGILVFRIFRQTHDT